MNPDRHQPRRILAAIDRDSSASSALSHAYAWAQQFGATLAVLHVGAEEPASRSQLTAASRELAAVIESVVSDDLLERELMVKFGKPGPVISETAASMEADLIVMGSHGRSTVGRWVLGSVAADVLRSTDIPVLVVKAPAGFIEHGTLVAAVDFSAASEAAVRYAGRLASTCAASLRLLHVLPIGDHQSPGHVVMRETAARSLREVQERQVPTAVETAVHVAMRMEATATAIAHYAEHQRASLIVMGGHGASGWTRGVLGSVTERVLHETSLPVLVVRRAPPTGS